jgi:transposase
MIGLFCFVLAVLASPFKSKSRLEAENAVLRHQLIVLRRKLKGRARLTNYDRWFFVQMYRCFPSILKVVTIVQPETLVSWHRAGFRRYWRWKSRRRGGRPRIEIELRALIRQMSTENQLWGAPRIHGELLKLGFSVAQSSVAKYMVKRRGPPSQGWKTFLRNHAPDIAAMDLLVVPTIGFKLLYCFVIVRIDRRDLVWINVTTNPTAEWIARQITEAFPWDDAPRYMIRDRDRIYGAVVARRLRAMGIRDKPIAPASPRQNGFAERLIGSIRRECLDHVIVVGEALCFVNNSRNFWPSASTYCPPRMIRIIEDLSGDWRHLGGRIEQVTEEIEVLARGTEGCRQLMTVPGVGPIIASAMMAAIGNGAAFAKGRNFAAWLGCRSKCRRAIGRSSVASASAGTAICACCSCRGLALFCSDRKLAKAQLRSVAHGRRKTPASQCSGNCTGQQAGADHLDRFGARAQLRSTRRAENTVSARVQPKG